jgi:hypothetical protein
MVISRYFGPNLKILFRDLAVMVAGFLAILLAPVFLFNVSALFDQVVAMRLVSRAVELNPLDSNNDFIVDFLFGNPGLLVLASYGFVFVVARNFRQFWPLVLWLGLIWISIYFLVPLRAKHLPIFLPVVALFAGFAIDHIFRFIIKLRNQQVSPRLIAMVLTIFAVLGMFIWNLPYAIAENNGQSLEADVNKERLTAIAFIDTIATYDDCVIADNPVFLYQTRRLPPPELSETSQTRIDSGYLSLQDVIRSIQTHKCHVVAVVTPRFGESMPGLQEWLAENYLGLHAQSETTVYFALKGDPAQRENEKDFTPVENGGFEGIARVNGVRLSGQSWPKENSAYVSLLWQLESPITDDYVEQIILRDTRSQEQVFRMNRVPFEGRFDPATWQVDQQVWDKFRLNFPVGLPPGSYDLNLSLCPLENGPCLSIDEHTGTEVYLGRITLYP